MRPLFQEMSESASGLVFPTTSHAYVTYVTAPRLLSHRSFGIQSRFHGRRAQNVPRWEERRLPRPPTVCKGGCAFAGGGWLGCLRFRIPLPLPKRVVRA